MTMKKSKLITNAFIAICFSFGALQLAAAEETRYPLTLKNCGRDITFTKAPTRVVSVGQNTTEILYALGLADKVKGTALWYSDVLPQFSAVNKTVKVLSHDVPSFESIIAEKPDLVASHQEWVIGPAGSSATYDQFNEFGIPVYTAPADCVGKDNMAGSDGLRSKPFTMDMIYQEITELSVIFNVPDRGKKLVQELKDREHAAIEKVQRLPKGKISAVFWYSSADLDIDPYVAGNLGAPGYIMNILGINNIVQSNYEWPTVGWETIVKKNPTIIVLAKMDRRRFPADDVAIKQQYLKNDPVTKLLPAVENNRLVVMDVQSMNTTMRTIDGIETLADAIVKLGLDK